MTQHFLPQVSAAPGPPTNHKPCLSCLLHRHWDVRGVLELTTRVSLHVKLVKSQSSLLLLLLLLTRHRAAAGGGWRRGRVEQGGEPLALHKNTIITPLQLQQLLNRSHPVSSRAALTSSPRDEGRDGGMERGWMEDGVSGFQR